MSVFSDILNAITTRGRRIQIKMGLAKDFNDSKLKVGELGLIIDKDEVRIGLANGTTKEVGTKLNNTLTSTSTTEGLTAAKGKELKDLINAIGTGGSGGLTLADIPIASVSQDGLMTKAMVSKLSGIASGANFVQVVDNLTTTSTTQAASANAIKTVNDKLTQHINDVMLHNGELNQYITNPDTNKIYRTITFKRTDGTTYMISNLSNPDTNGNYQTLLWEFYATNGTTKTLTKTWTMTYDSDGNITSKVVS